MEKKKIKVAGSILAADFGCLADEAKRLESSGADAIHIDIMDGHFVPNITFGPNAVEAMNRASDIFLDVHLMIYNPFDYIEKFVEAGADLITFHVEATEDVADTLEFIKKCNCKAGLALNPETSFSLIERYLVNCDLLLFMSVHPGFSGQKFMPQVLKKIELAANISKKIKHPLEIQVDGGIDDKTAPLCISAGANFLVSGHYLYNMENLQSGIKILKGC